MLSKFSSNHENFSTKSTSYAYVVRPGEGREPLGQATFLKSYRSLQLRLWFSSNFEWNRIGSYDFLLVFWSFSEKNMRFSKKISTKAVQKPYLKTNASGFLHSFSVKKINQKFMSVHVLLRDLLRNGLMCFSVLLLHQRPSVKWKILSNLRCKIR